MPDNLRGYSPVPIPEPVYRAAAAVAWRDLRNVLQRADFVTAPTPYAVDLLRRRARIERARTISCGVDIEVYRPTGHIARHLDPTVLFVGRLDREKHIDNIIDALHMLGGSARLRIVGQGSMGDALRLRTVRCGVDTRVAFLGQLTDDEVRDEYARAHVFCMPGNAELQSIATLEAMASGLPVVAANAHALPLLVAPGLNGELFQPGDVDGLAVGLQRILGDADRARAYGAASLDRVRAHDINYTLDAFESLYEQAAGGS
jgi:glycosyltransferase involved in cell wall biosynthesis